MFDLNEVLVPVDFSDASRAAFARALTLVGGDAPAIVLQHVIDPSFADLAEAYGLGARGEILVRMRERAASELEEMAASAAMPVQVTPVVSEGIPFYEIVSRAEEFDVDAVIIGRSGMQNRAEALFFGSTAERVVRACTRPVIVLPQG
ncbi:MAG: universal stress protein [Chloroflexi bacterium]|nr:universal stress protein [Chloroflexota bacterium]